jgi:hypothetical protein
MEEEGIYVNEVTTFAVKKMARSSETKRNRKRKKRE